MAGKLCTRFEPENPCPYEPIGVCGFINENSECCVEEFFQYHGVRLYAVEAK